LPVEPDNPDEVSTAEVAPLPRGKPGPALRHPERVGPYRVEELIDSGGMGLVLRARHEDSGQLVALKIARLAATKDSKRRFERESRILARLHHPHIAQLYNTGVDETQGEPTRYFAMEFVEGALSLTTYANQHQLRTRDRLALFIKVCRAVHEAHMHGIVHRDLKPGNILVGEDGEPRVIDFGVARLLGGNLTLEQATITGSVVGTVGYMSPEQAAGETRRITWRSDVYSLGAVLCELLTGRLPHQIHNMSIPEAARAIREAPPTIGRTVDGASLGPLQSILLKALQPEPSERYASAEALAADLERYVAGEPLEAGGSRSPSILLSHVRRTLGARPRLLVAACVLLGAAISWYLVIPASFLGAGIDNSYRAWLTTTFPPGQELQGVRVIAATDEDDLEALAARAGVEGVEGVESNNVLSYRALYGELMRRLADADPAAVVFDIAFPRPSPYDPPFIRGLEALEQAEVPVVVGVSRLERTENLLFPLNEAFAPHVSWGALHGDFGAASPWAIALAIHREDQDAIPSLALATLAALRQPDSVPTYRLRPDDGVVNVSFWKYNPDVPGARAPAAPSLAVPVTTIAPFGRRRLDLGMERDDLVALYQLALPPQNRLEAARIALDEAMRLDSVELSQAVGGRVVIIANLRGGRDLHPTPDGRMLGGPFAHALAIQSLLTDASVRMPPPAPAAILLLVSGGLAAGVAVRFWRRPLLGLPAVCGVAVLLSAAAVAAYPLADAAINPLAPASAALISGTLSAGAWSLRQPIAR